MFYTQCMRNKCWVRIEDVQKIYESNVIILEKVVHSVLTLSEEVDRISDEELYKKIYKAELSKVLRR